MPVTETPTGDAGTRAAFSKAQRLLIPREFKAVFDGAVYKASHRSLLLLALPREDGPARLGLVVAKKSARLAVQRNRLKRQLRESFRHHQLALAGLDIIALVKPGLWQLDNRAVRELVDSQWQRLLKQQQKAAAEQAP